MKVKLLLFSIAATLLVPQLLFAAPSESLRIISSTQSPRVGDSFTITVQVVSLEQSMNAVSGTFVYPGGATLASISKQGSVISFWTQEAQSLANKVRFEGVAVNPGYQGPGGTIFTATFVPKKEGPLNFYFADGAILANDGLGTNILTSLGTLTLNVAKAGTPGAVDLPVSTLSKPSKLVALPVITEYSQAVEGKTPAFIKGKGEPNALTKLSFNNIAVQSLGEQFINLLQPKRKKLDSVLVKNDSTGVFQYTSPSNLVAGTYNATPFLVDAATQSERPGLGVQLFVNDSPVVKFLVVLINVLGLLIPVVGLAVVIYFIPWYSWRRMRLIRRRLGLEEERIELSEHQLKREDKVLDSALAAKGVVEER